MNILIKKLPAFLFLSLSLFVISCEKKWKKPSDVSFGFMLNSNSGSGLVKFSSGYFLLSEIDFDGQRKQGSSNVNFTKEYDPNEQVSLNISALSPGIVFDIPQGTYTSINVDAKIEEQSNNAPNLVLYGTYINTINDTLAVRFEFSSGDNFEMTASNSSGTNEILLMEDRSSTASIIFNPKYWFDIVPQSMFESADVVIENGIPTIIISENENEDIYQLVADRVEDGNQIIID